MRLFTVMGSWGSRATVYGVWGASVQKVGFSAWRGPSWARFKVCALNNANSDKPITRVYATNFKRLLAVLSGRNPSTATAACSHK